MNGQELRTDVIAGILFCRIDFYQQKQTGNKPQATLQYNGFPKNKYIPENVTELKPIIVALISQNYQRKQ